MKVQAVHSWHIWMWCLWLAAATGNRTTLRLVPSGAPMS